MNRYDFYIMITILFIGFCFIYVIHPKPISIIKYPSVRTSKIILKDENGKSIDFIRKQVN